MSERLLEDEVACHVLETIFSSSVPSLQRLELLRSTCVPELGRFAQCAQQIHREHSDSLGGFTQAFPALVKIAQDVEILLKEKVFHPSATPNDFLRGSRTCLISHSDWAVAMDLWAGPDDPSLANRLKDNEALIKGAGLLIECLRLSCNQRWSWSYPTPQALQKIHEIADYGLVVDLGCGKGMWVRSLATVGVQVTGVDVHYAETRNPFVTGEVDGQKNEDDGAMMCHTLTVEEILPIVEKATVLLMCWVQPEEQVSAAFARYVQVFQGSFVVLVDDEQVAHCRGLALRERMEKEWKQIWREALPSFPDRPDWMSIWTRHDSSQLSVNQSMNQ